MSQPPRGPDGARPEPPERQGADGPQHDPGQPCDGQPSSQRPGRQGASQPGMTGAPSGSGEPAAQQHSRNRIIDTSAGRSDGLDKCPSCGSTDIHYSIRSGSLVCGYCRSEWNEEVAEQAFGLDSSIAELRGHTLASGTADIREDGTVMTLKCEGCGAEVVGGGAGVVIRGGEELQAGGHWCRQTLAVNTQIPNGAVADAILPFQLTRDQAIERINEFVGKRRTFALGRFKKEFVPDNVM